MGLKDFLEKLAHPFDKTSSKLNSLVDCMEDGLLKKMVKTGLSASAVAAYLATYIVPEIAAGVTATAFLGGMVYKYFSEKNKKTINRSISSSGLKAKGAPYLNGIDAQKELTLLNASLKISNQR